MGPFLTLGFLASAICMRATAGPVEKTGALFLDRYLDAGVQDSAADRGMAGLVRTFQADLASTQHFYGPEGTDEWVERTQELLATWEAALGRLRFSDLGPQGRIGYLLLKNHIRRERVGLSRSAESLTELKPLLPGFDLVARLMRDHRRRFFPTGEAAGAVLAEIRKSAETVLAETRTAGKRTRNSYRPRKLTARSTGRTLW